MEAPIPAGPCPARPVAADTTALLRAADRMEAEATPAAVRMAALPVADTITTDGFPPRFTPHRTHRQEAPKGASCPPHTERADEKADFVWQYPAQSRIQFWRYAAQLRTKLTI